MDFRYLFDGIEDKVKLDDGNKVIPINFDNGATTPPLQWVNTMVQKNARMYGPISRGLGQKGDWCTKTFEEARERILKFFNLEGRTDYSVIYVKNTTEGINLLAQSLIRNKSDRVLMTRMEHHANDLPWRYAGEAEYIEVDSVGRLRLNELEQRLIAANGRIKYVSVTGASNVTGYINPIHKIARIAHRYHAKVIVDAAQLVAHQRINMAEEEGNDAIDFLVFSGHKMYAPYGSGIVIGLKRELDKVTPFLKGGGAVDEVFDDDLIWRKSPNRYEAGTQNYLGVMSIVVAMEVLDSVGFIQISRHEAEIRDYLIQELRRIPGVILYGDSQYTEDRLGIVCFNIKGRDHSEVGYQLANEFGIATRCGKFCSHPYVSRLLGKENTRKAVEEHRGCEKEEGMIRISLGLYNTLEEARYAISVIRYIANRKYY